MADISAYINNIRNSQPGETVRDAIIAAAKLINNYGGSSGSLGGKDASYYATFDEFADLLDKASRLLKTTDVLTDIKPDCDKMMTSGILYDDLVIFDNALKAILNLEIQPPEDEGSEKALIRIEHQLAKIQKIRNEIADAIEGKKSSIDMTNDTTFREYADIIRHFITDDNVQIDDTYEVTKDGKVKATKGHAWINVDASEFEYKTTTKSYSKNVTNDTPGSNYIGFSEVSVNVTTRTGSGGSNISSARSTGKNGEGIDEDGMMDIKVITENTGDGGITPDEDGAVGWRHISVQVTEPDWDETATFTVIFKNGDEEIGRDENVPFDGYATYDGDTPVSEEEGYYFCGWDPAPRKIRFNTVCFAQFTNVEPAEGEIPDTWEEIAECAGANYAIGQYKTLTPLNCDHVYDSSGNHVVIPFSSHPIRMRKVAAGEDGTTSTWLAMDGLSPTHYGGTGVGWYRSIYGGRKWSDSFVRKFLNGDFYAQSIPDSIRSAIQPVTKYTRASRGDMIYEEKTVDMIWIPSLRELFNVPNASNEQAAYNAFVACSTPQRLDQGAARWYRFVNMEKSGMFYGQIFENADGSYTTDPAQSDSFERGLSYIVPHTPSKYQVRENAGSGNPVNYMLRSVWQTDGYERAFGYYINSEGTINGPSTHSDGDFTISDTTGWAQPYFYVIGFCL